MARYIDADKLVEMYERSADDEWNKKTAPSSWAEAFECAIADIDDQPTADVVPRAEVAREIFEEIEELFRQHKEGGYYLNGAWFPERLDLYTEDAFAELKKKYTEGQK